jgi:hypothetical protein
LHAAGVPLSAVSGHLRELRGQVEHISERFLDFTTQYVFRRFLHHPPTDDEAAEAAALVRRLRPLARQTLDAELARAMGKGASEAVRRHLGDVLPPGPAAPAAPTPSGPPAPGAAAGPPIRPAPPLPAPAAGACPGACPGDVGTPVTLPAATVAAVRELVGADRVAAFVAAAAEREVAARRMDAWAAGPGRGPRARGEDPEGGPGGKEGQAS